MIYCGFIDRQPGYDRFPGIPTCFSYLGQSPKVHNKACAMNAQSIVKSDINIYTPLFPLEKRKITGFLVK